MKGSERQREKERKRERRVCENNKALLKIFAFNYLLEILLVYLQLDSKIILSLVLTYLLHTSEIYS